MNAAMSAIVDEARAVRIEDELARRGLPFWTKPRHSSLGQPCPICGGHDRFSVSTKKQFFNCRGCEKAGDVIALVQAIDGVDFKTAVEKLAGEKAFKPNGGARRTLVRTLPPYAYCNPGTGETAYTKTRHEYSDRSKLIPFDNGGRKGPPLLYGGERLADLGEGQRGLSKARNASIECASSAPSQSRETPGTNQNGWPHMPKCCAGCR